MYNSTDREFIQKDPKAGNVYETLTQNGYIYCGDNPLYYIDPDGCSYISTLGNAGRTAFNVVKSGVAGGLGFYTRIYCEIDNMPTWAKAAVGTTGIIIAGASGVGAAAIAEAVIASAGISAATDGAFYSIYALNNGSFSKSELKDTVINGAANGYMFAGAGLGVAGIQNAAKSGKLAGFMADEAGSVSYEGGRTSGIWDMTEGGGVINGREYSQHAMERMAPDTPTVRAELSRRAEKAAQQKGLEVGTKEYYEYCTKYVDPRNIPPSVIEDAISSSKAIPGNRSDTFIHETLDVKVVVNDSEIDAKVEKIYDKKSEDVVAIKIMEQNAIIYNTRVQEFGIIYRKIQGFKIPIESVVEKNKKLGVYVIDEENKMPKFVNIGEDYYKDAKYYYVDYNKNKESLNLYDRILLYPNFINKNIKVSR